MSSFISLVQVEFRHNYFKDGVARVLKATLPPNTASLLADLGLIVKFLPGSIHLFGQENSDWKQRIEQEGLELEFELQLTGPYFVHYTVLPQEDGIFQFTNLNPTSSEVQLLQDVLPHQFLQNPFGILRLKLTEGMFQDQNLPLFMELNFEARATIWRYIFFNEQLWSKPDLHIESDGNHFFSTPTWTELPDGSPGVLIQSLHPIALKEIKAFHLKLMSGSDLLIKILPAASPELLIVKNGQYYSDIYIHF